MSTISANSLIYQNAFRFQIVIDGIANAGFTTISGLTKEVAVVEHFQGGALIANKSPGRVTYGNVTLSRGHVNEDSDLYDWIEQVINAGVIPPSGVGQGVGTAGNAFKRTVDIQNLRDDGTVAQTYRLFNSWPMRYTPGDYDNGGDEKLMEEIELAYDYFVRLPA